MSAQVLVSEPIHRVSSTSSGISFRMLPQASLDEIRKTCDYYLKKGQGTYNHRTLAGRYLYNLATEVKLIADKLEVLWTNTVNDQTQRISHYDNLLSEYRLLFGQEVGPKQIYDEIENYKKQNKQIYDLLQEEKEKHAVIERDMYKLVNEHHRVSREALARGRHLMENSNQIKVELLQGNEEDTEDELKSLKFEKTKLEEELKQKEEEIRLLKGQISNYKNDIIPKINAKWEKKLRAIKKQFNATIEIPNKKGQSIEETASFESPKPNPPPPVPDKLDHWTRKLLEIEKDQVQLLQRAKTPLQRDKSNN